MLNPATPFPNAKYEWKEPSSKIYVVAGNRGEFVDYLKKKEAEGKGNDYYYVQSAMTLRGLSSIKGVFIGSWAQRLDIAEIQQQIAIIKEKMKYDEQISISAGILAQEIDNSVLTTLIPTNIVPTTTISDGTISGSSNIRMYDELENSTWFRELVKKYIDEELKSR